MPDLAGSPRFASGEFRACLVDERTGMRLLATLKAERAQVAAKGKQAEAEAAPIMYVAEMLGAPRLPCGRPD